MPVSGFDHVAIPTKDAEKFIAFYKRLGFNILDEDAWRKGEARLFAVQAGPSNKINVHPPELRGKASTGATTTPGCGDLCFVFDGTMEDALQMIKDAGVEIVAGPGPRKGGRAGGTMANSLYVRDPDENLLEFMVYD